MVVGNVPEAVDFVVAGAGPGGYTAALEAARRGRRVLLVDRAGEAGIGGVCLQVGCIPSKALIEVAELAERVGEAAEFGLGASAGPLDMARFQRWKGGVVDRLTRAVASSLESAGVQVERGHLRLTAPDTAVIADEGGGARFVRFGDLVLATGSSPTPLSELPFDGDRVLDSTGVLALESLPATVSVIGAGYIGVELGIALAKLGSRVTLVESEARILPGMDASLARPVGRRMRQLGVEVLTTTRAVGVDEGRLEVHGASGPRWVEAEKIVVAIGRRPATGELGIEAIDVAADTAALLPVGADRRLAAHVAAIGDITPGPALAHKAYAEARVAVAALCGDRVAFDPAAIPQVVFSDPEIASAGLTREAAREQGVDAVATEVPVGVSGRAATMNRRLGSATIVSDAKDGTVLGVHVVGPHASELVAEGVLAIEMGATVEDVALTIHPHPTLGEQIREAAGLAARGRAGSPAPGRDPG